MNFLRLLPVFLSALLLGAHFLRLELIPFVVLALLFPAFLLFKRLWATRLVQIFLVLGALEWIRILLIYVDERREDGQPWIRLALILGFIAVFTGGSALLFYFSPSLRKRYGPDNSLTEDSNM